jgi:hypothetical protein
MIALVIVSIFILICLYLFFYKRSSGLTGGFGKSINDLTLHPLYVCLDLIGSDKENKHDINIILYRYAIIKNITDFITKNDKTEYGKYMLRKLMPIHISWNGKGSPHIYVARCLFKPLSKVEIGNVKTFYEYYYQFLLFDVYLFGLFGIIIGDTYCDNIFIKNNEFTRVDYDLQSIFYCAASERVLPSYLPKYIENGVIAARTFTIPEILYSIPTNDRFFTNSYAYGFVFRVHELKLLHYLNHYFKIPDNVINKFKSLWTSSARLENIIECVFCQLKRVKKFFKMPLFLGSSIEYATIPFAPEGRSECFCDMSSYVKRFPGISAKIDYDAFRDIGPFTVHCDNYNSFVDFCNRSREKLLTTFNEKAPTKTNIPPKCKLKLEQLGKNEQIRIN